MIDDIDNPKKTLSSSSIKIRLVIIVAANNSSNILFTSNPHLELDEKFLHVLEDLSILHIYISIYHYIFVRPAWSGNKDMLL